MQITDCFIVYWTNKPVAVFINQQSAYTFIDAQGNINPTEWQIVKSKFHMPTEDRAIAGKLNVMIPKHVLE